MSYQHWILTIPYDKYVQPTELPEFAVYIKGQKEIGVSGYEHWQLYYVTKRKIRLSQFKTLLPSEAHIEPTRSAAARDYVWKDESAAGSRFQLGELPMRRNAKTDWKLVKESAKRGSLDEIPDDVFVQHYKTLKQIEKDHMKPVGVEKNVCVYWGRAGAGKSRAAWEEAGLDAYPKDPNTKYWDGYSNHQNVVIDEFRGRIDIGHMLRWLDRYPVCVETKFGGCVFVATRIWITSNIHPNEWYPNLDEETKAGLLRRLTIKHFH